MNDKVFLDGVDPEGLIPPSSSPASTSAPLRPPTPQDDHDEAKQKSLDG